MSEWLYSALNNPLLISVAVILLSSFIGFYVQTRVRDRCLRDLHDFGVTVEDTGGKVAWGVLCVYSSGVELLYTSEHKDSQGHVENSYILYDAELQAMQAIYRFHHDQSAANQLRRQQDIRRAYQPSLFRRAARALRNVFSTFKDAIVQATNTVLGYRATLNPQSVILSKHQELTASGMQLLGSAAGSAYDPILERYIGKYVTLEILRGAKVEEEYGILKEYSSKYIELLNVKVEVPIEMFLKVRSLPRDGPVRIDWGEHAARVTNGLDHVLWIEAVRCEGERREVGVPVPAMESAEIQLVDAEIGGPGELEVGVRCLADMIVPRKLAAVRHAGKRDKISLEILLGLDELTHFPWVKRLVGVSQGRIFGDPEDA